MRPGLARAISYGIILSLGALAVRYTPQLPERAPAELLAEQQGEQRSSSLQQRFDTLGRGETLARLFRRAGVSDQTLAAVLRAATSAGVGLDERRVRAGMPAEFRLEHPDSAPKEIILHLDVDRIIHLRRADSGWVGTEERLPWRTDTVLVAGTITSTLYDAMDSSASATLPVGARRQLAWNLADVFDYRIDMSRDLQRGDGFRVMAERSVTTSGVQRIGKILAAAFTLSGRTMKAFRFENDSASGNYFDENGKSLKAAFLRAPLQFRAISSYFGMRKHPIFGVWRQHKGTDYAASAGTPVRAIGAGVVVRAGWGTGYGNVLDIRHPNGYVTRYGHLKGFASGIHAGSRVTIGETVAYVGMTGYATAPHLHFEVIVNGVQRDSRTAFRSASGEPVPSRQIAAFNAVRDRSKALLERSSSGGVTVAER